jgi:hypothetical protein
MVAAYAVAILDFWVCAPSLLAGLINAMRSML